VHKVPPDFRDVKVFRVQQVLPVLKDLKEL
jgi:hypothetical protein